MMGIETSIVFDSSALRARQARVTKTFLKAATDAVRTTTRALEKDIEKAMEAAGLGKLSRAPASAVYPKRGQAYEPVGIVYANGRERTQGAYKAYSEGAQIRGKAGQFLAIPLPAAGPRRRGRDLTPGEWERRTGIRLRFVYRRGRPSLLVADEGTINNRTGTFRQRTARRKASGRGSTTVPIFILLPRVDVRQRFSIDRIRAPYPERLKREFLAELARTPEPNR